jgi:hypothetical protein
MTECYMDCQIKDVAMYDRLVAKAREVRNLQLFL